LDIPALKVYAAANRKRTPVSGEYHYEYPLLTLACDVLIPAALENQITEENVHQIQADIVAEAANGPVTHGRPGVGARCDGVAGHLDQCWGVVVLPGVGTGPSHVFWDEQRVNREMEAYGASYHQVTQESKARQVPRRLAAHTGRRSNAQAPLTEASTHNWSKIVFKKADSYRLR